MGLLIQLGHAQESFSAYEKEYLEAKQAILDGHVKDGIGRIAALVQKIDPAVEPNNYWLLSANLAEFLHQVEPTPKQAPF